MKESMVEALGPPKDPGVLPAVEEASAARPSREGDGFDLDGTVPEHQKAPADRA